MNCIGWNPPTAELRAWIFGSEGANDEGFWHLDGDNEVLKSTVRQASTPVPESATDHK